MHADACIILSAEHLLNKMRTLAHLILAFAIWLAVHMETAIEAFGVPPNITMAVGGEVGEVIHMHVHLAMCIWQRAHTSTHSRARQNQEPSRLLPHAHMLSASVHMSSTIFVFRSHACHTKGCGSLGVN